MPSTALRIPLSAATNWRGIKIVATATLGTALHTAHATLHEEVRLYVFCGHTANVLLTLEAGGVTVPDDIMKETIPFDSGWWPLPMFMVGGSVVVTAFASVANVLAIRGYVNQITP